MADKYFGVKGLSIIGVAGTSYVTGPTNLNINASTVAISTDVSIGGKVSSNLVVSNSYSVGIGTTVLNEKLNVNGNVSVSGIISASDFVGSGIGLTGVIKNQIVGINTDVYQYFVVTEQTSGSISTVSVTNNLLTLNAAAKYLGIATDSPSANLDVYGTGKFSDTVTAPNFSGTATTANNLSNAGNITTGFISSSRLTGSYPISITGTATSLSDAVNILSGTISTSRLPNIITSNINVISGISTVGNLTATNATINNLTFTSGIAITSVDTDLLSVSSLDDTLASAKAIKTYVDYRVAYGISDTYLRYSGDVGIGTVGIGSQTFNIVGTSNEIETVGSGLTLTIGLPNTVAITTSLKVGSGVTIVSSGINIGSGIITATLSNSLTLNTSGIGLSGSATYNNSGSSAFTVTSNATNNNTANTIVSRDASGDFSAGTITANLTGTATTASGLTTTANVNTSGIITAKTFSTGISTQNIGFTTGIISGPNTILISPYSIGISTGTVKILGNLQVDGTTITNTQQTIQSSAKTVGVAISETDNILLNDAGITIGATAIQKTLFWNYASLSLKSSENFNIALGKVYKINDNDILSSTQLANSVVTSGLTTVGTLKQLNVSGVSTFSGPVGLCSSVKDFYGNVGAAGSILVSTGTGVSWTAPFAAGIQGLQGTQGLQGIQGTQGTQGLQGIQGTQGTQGLTGPIAGSNTQVIYNNNNVSAGATDFVYIASSRNVGIGTTNPTSKLQVGGVIGFNDTHIKIGNNLTGASITSGSNNIFIGNNSGYAVTSSVYNVFLGDNAGYATNSGVSNSFIGGFSGYSNTTGSYNVFVGDNAGYGNTTGGNNVFLGRQAGRSNTTGYNNTYLGYSAGSQNTGGTNTFVGGYAGSNQLSGNYNVVLGNYTDLPNLNGSNQLVIGNILNNWIIGNSSFNIGIGTTNPTSKLHVVGDGYFSGIVTCTDLNTSSDYNLKNNIQKVENALEKILELNGVTFNWKETNRPSIGVIAQEVEKVLPELVSGENLKTVNYNGFVGIFVECIKELKNEINYLKDEINELRKNS